MAADQASMDVLVKFGDSRTNLLEIFDVAFLMDDERRTASVDACHRIRQNAITPYWRFADRGITHTISNGQLRQTDHYTDIHYVTDRVMTRQ